MAHGAQGAGTGERTLTLAEAAAACGTTAKALQRRIDRNSLQSVLVNGRRMIPVTELVRAGLLNPGGSPGQPPAGAPRGATGDAPEGETRVVGVDARELLDRLLAQERELGELRALTREAESLRVRAEGERVARETLEGELHEARAKVMELEARTAAEVADREARAQALEAELEDTRKRLVELEAKAEAVRPGFWRRVFGGGQATT